MSGVNLLYVLTAISGFPECEEVVVNKKGIVIVLAVQCGDMNPGWHERDMKGRARLYNIPLTTRSWKTAGSVPRDGVGCSDDMPREVVFSTGIQERPQQCRVVGIEIGGGAEWGSWVDIDKRE